MLNGTLTLHDIHDVEAFTTRIVVNAGYRRGHPLQDDLIAHLIGEAWILSDDYDPNRSRIPFSALATATLKRRLIDWLRTNVEDRRYPIRYTETSYDQLDRDLPASSLGDPEHRAAHDLRLHHQGDRQEPRPYPSLDRRPARAAA